MAPNDFVDRFSAVARRLRALAAERYAALEIGTAQAKFLRHIGRHRGISQAELARATDTAPTLTGRALAPLIERGWVQRQRSRDDRREYVLALTAAGRRALARVDSARAGLVARVGKLLDGRDRGDFDRIATKLLDGLGEPKR